MMRKYTAYDIATFQLMAEDNPCLPLEEDIHLWSDSHERKIEKKYDFQSLSDEAQEVIKIVLACPSEILDLLITPKTGKISKEAKQNLYTYFRKKWGWSTKKVFAEISEYTNSL